MHTQTSTIFHNVLTVLKSMVKDNGIFSIKSHYSHIQSHVKLTLRARMALNLNECYKELYLEMSCKCFMVAYISS